MPDLSVDDKCTSRVGFIRVLLKDGINCTLFLAVNSVQLHFSVLCLFFLGPTLDRCLWHQFLHLRQERILPADEEHH